MLAHGRILMEGGQVMDEGRLPYNTYVRCTDKTLTCTAGGIARADYSGGVSCMRLHEDTLCMSSTGTAFYSSALLEMSFYRCVNALLAAGGRPQALTVHIHIPQRMEERDLREHMRMLDALCAGHGITLLPGALEATRAAEAPCYVLSAIGKRTVERRVPKPGDALLQVRGAGLFGTGLLLTLRREALLTRFSEAFLLQAEEKVSCADITDITMLLDERKVYLLPVAEGGILAALWDLKSASGLGFEADLRALLIEQETVEIAEFLGVNPYRLAGDGALLLATNEPEAVCGLLAAAGIPVSVIGTVTAGPAGNIKKDDEISSISRPEPDELFRFLQ